MTPTDIITQQRAIGNRPPSDPIDCLREAVMRCRVQVRGTDHNVCITAGYEMWSMQHPGPVSLIGAHLLLVQPAPDADELDSPDPMGCATRSLGCPFLWLEGAVDGFARRPDINRVTQWEAKDLRWQQYGKGLREGYRLADEMERIGKR